MYAVIKTGGKQYRVKAGDVLVVEKLMGEPGARVDFDQVLAIGEGSSVTLGAPTVAGASVTATLIETRKGEKVKIFKKIRRQGYRRTRGHRQPETVLRVTALAANGQTETWDGEVALTSKAELNLRARNLARPVSALTPAGVHVETVVETEGKTKGRAKVIEVADAVAEAAPVAETAAAEAPKKAGTKKASASAKPGPVKAAQAKAPKPGKGSAPKTVVRKTAPRGKGG
jgi:large subunit ribosomal protein L21